MKRRAAQTLAWIGVLVLLAVYAMIDVGELDRIFGGWK